MKFSSRIILSCLLLSLTFSCSDSGLTITNVVTCDDGVKNGDETGIDCGGSCPEVCPPENAIFGEVLDILNLTSDNEYVLTGPLLVRDGAQLLIESGTVIKAQPNAYIAIAQGGQIYALGASDDPIVFTSNSTSKVPGDWGGIVILGQAPINTEVVDRSDLLDLFYGGVNSTDDSGVMQYVRIEYAGAPYTNEKNFNGLSLYGIGSFTNIKNIQIVESLGNGISGVGGTVNLENIVINASQENGITFQDGWNGMVQNLYVSNALGSGIHISNNEENEIREPITTGSIENISLIAPFSQGGIELNQGGGSVTINELYTVGLHLGINVIGSTATTLIDQGNFQITTVEFDSTTSDFVPTNYDGSNPDFYIIGNSFGAGNKEQLPDWALNWAIDF